MKAPAPLPCPNPAKVTYGTVKAADDAARNMARHKNRQGHIQEPLYWYLCRCRRIHVTRSRLGPFGDENTLLLDWPEDLQRWAIGEAAGV